MVDSVSVGIYQGMPVIDLDYADDKDALTDMNVVMNNQGGFIEIQGTAEKTVFAQAELDQMLVLAKNGIKQLVAMQKTGI